MPVKEAETHFSEAQVNDENTYSFRQRHVLLLNAHNGREGTNIRFTVWVSYNLRTEVAQTSFHVSTLQREKDLHG
jgi:hypothetical protein